MAASPSAKGLTPSDFIFEGGDVEITIKHNGTQFKGRVCSQPMVLASPVFKRFIYPPWQVAQPAQPAARFSFFSPHSGSNFHPALPPMQPPIGNIDFSDDPASTLLIILRIIHLNLSNLPGEISSAELLQLALLCEQYQCATLISTFAIEWIEEASHNEYTSEVGKDSWLLIYWTFGYPDDYLRLAEELVLAVSLDGDGNVWFPNSDYYGEMQMVSEIMPDKALEGILGARETMLRNLLAIPYSLVDEFEAIDDELHANWPICDLPACNSMAYGSLLLKLQIAQLWPRRQASEIYENVETVARDIANLVVSVHPDVDGLKHDTCKERASFMNPVKELMKNVEDPVLECHRLHMGRGR